MIDSKSKKNIRALSKGVAKGWLRLAKRGVLPFPGTGAAVELLVDAVEEAITELVVTLENEGE